MDETLQKFEFNRSKVNSGFITISMAHIPFASMMAGYMIGKGMTLDAAIEASEKIENLYSHKKCIDDREYVLLLNAVFANPDSLLKLQDKIMIPKAARQPIDVQAELLLLFGETNLINTQPLSDDTVDIPEQFLLEEEEYKTKMEEEEKTMKLIAQLCQQDQTSNVEENEDCEICLMGLYQQSMVPFPLQNCGHVFHTECLQSCLNASILERKFPLKCPNEGCNCDVFEKDIKEALSVEFLEKYEQFTLKNYFQTNPESVSWCPTAGCSYVFFYNAQDPVRFQCEMCKKEYCLLCRVEWHSQMTCKEYKVTNSFGEDDEKFMDFVNGQKYKQCPKCKAWVSKTQGCDHMVCRCKYEFCYKCGGKYMECDCNRIARERLEVRRQKAQKRQRNKEKKLAAVLIPKRSRRRKDDDDQFQEIEGSNRANTKSRRRN